MIQKWYCKEKLDACHSSGLRINMLFALSTHLFTLAAFYCLSSALTDRCFFFFDFWNKRTKYPVTMDTVWKLWVTKELSKLITASIETKLCRLESLHWYTFYVCKWPFSASSMRVRHKRIQFTMQRAQMTLDAKLALCLEARFGREGLIEMIPQYWTAHPLLRIKIT